jgi:hypothetical protein
MCDLTDAGGRISRLGECASPDADPPFSKDFSEHRGLLAWAIMATSNLAYLVRPFEECHAWGEQALKEFQTSPHVAVAGRELRAAELPDLMVEVIDRLATPLWEALVKVVPEIRPQVQQLAKNRALWDGGKSKR